MELNKAERERERERGGKRDKMRVSEFNKKIRLCLITVFVFYF